MKKNDLLELNITDIGTDGEGIGKYEGFTFFVKDAIPGDVIEARVIKLKKNYGYGRVERVIKPSPFRVKPECEHARKCGGCQIMEMRYDKQLDFKQNKVRNNLIRIGGFEASYIDEIMEPIVGMNEADYMESIIEKNEADYMEPIIGKNEDDYVEPIIGTHEENYIHKKSGVVSKEDFTPLRYRNKSQYPVGLDKDGNIITGFYAGRTHSIISCKDCKLGPVYNKDILEIIVNHMKKYNIKAYNEDTNTGLVRHVLIREGKATGQVMVCIVINGDSIPCDNELCERLSVINGMTSISISLNKEKTNVIMGDNYKTIWGKDKIMDIMKVRKPGNNNDEFMRCYDENGLSFEISPLSFYQVNPVQVEKLYGIAIDYASLSKEDEVWDLCCGIGTITLAMASQCKMVHGIEIVPQAIDDAKENARRNGIINAEFICAPAEVYLPKHASSIKADVIVMDPPRKGMDEEALKVVVNTAPERIVYVSCDSATLARDLKYLCENGYELKRWRACDMFGQSVHVETVVLITRKEK